MNTTSWNEFYKDTAHLRKATNIKAILSENDITILHQLVKEVLFNFIEKGETHIGLKTYVNRKLEPLGEKMKSFPPIDEDTWEAWAHKIFGDDKFGMILNSLEIYSNTFSEKAATIIKPLIDNAGIPLGGISFLFFMGNYGFTPFGVHKEATGEEGILFHLGPGKKQFYTWDDPELNKIEHNTEVFHDFDTMMKDATCYELHPGDAMFIPHQVYHIANSSEFSLSVVMDYINPPEHILMNELFEISKKDMLSNNRYCSPVKNDDNYNSHTLDETFLNQKIDRAFQFKIHALKSNGGLVNPSLSNKRNSIPNGNFAIKGKQAFPIQILDIDPENCIVFARGHHFKVRKNTQLSSVIEQLNDQKVLSFVKAQELLLDEWELSEIYGLVSDLMIVEAIVVVD